MKYPIFYGDIHNHCERLEQVVGEISPRAPTPIKLCAWRSKEMRPRVLIPVAVRTCTRRVFAAAPLQGVR